MGLLKMFQLRVIRDKSTGAEDDDVITITYDSGDVYNFSFVESKNRFLTTFSREKLVEYLEVLLYNLAYDSCPFHSLQVNSPLFPQVMYGVKDLEYEDCCEKIIDMFSLTCDAWANPPGLTYEAPVPTRSTRQDYTYTYDTPVNDRWY